MTAWDIDPDGVADVLSRVHAQMTDLLEEFAQIGAATQRAAENSSSLIVAEALSNFFSAMSLDMSGITRRVSSAMSACVTATNAYLAADASMADHARAAAGR